MMMTSKKFAIAAIPRSGSTLVYEILRAHGIKGIFEPLNVDLYSLDNIIYSDCSRIVNYIKNVYKKYDFIKHLVFQYHECGINRYLVASLPSIIMHRNPAESALSFMIAQQTEIWHRWNIKNQDQALNIPAITIDIDELLVWSRLFEKLYIDTISSASNFIEIDYNDILNDIDSVLLKMSDFLNVEIQINKIEHLIDKKNKVTTNDIINKITNKKEVMEFVKWQNQKI